MDICLISITGIKMSEIVVGKNEKHTRSHLGEESGQIAMAAWRILLLSKSTINILM